MPSARQCCLEAELHDGRGGSTLYPEALHTLYIPLGQVYAQ